MIKEIMFIIATNVLAGLKNLKKFNVTYERI